MQTNMALALLVVTGTFFVTPPQVSAAPLAGYKATLLEPSLIQKVRRRWGGRGWRRPYYYGYGYPYSYAYRRPYYYGYYAPYYPPPPVYYYRPYYRPYYYDYGY